MTRKEGCNVSDLVLTPQSALGGYDKGFNGTVLREIADLAIVSVAVPIGGSKDLSKAVKSAYGCALPKPDISVLSKDETTRLVSSQADQVLVLFDNVAPDGGSKVASALGDAGYYTDQTDNWAVLSLSGPDARAALERLCRVDLAANSFALNASTRTMMEHLGVLVIRTGEDGFLLLSARSSAKSFLHAVEISVKNVT
jgi:sarcosine oxidase subunit gamma